MFTHRIQSVFAFAICFLFASGFGCSQERKPMPQKTQYQESARDSGDGRTDVVIQDQGEQTEQAAPESTYTGGDGVSVSFTPFGIDAGVYAGFKLAYKGDDGAKKEFDLEPVSGTTATPYSVKLDPSQSSYKFYIKLYNGNDELIAHTKEDQNGLCDPVIWNSGDPLSVDLSDIYVCLVDRFGKMYSWNKDGLKTQFLYQKFGLHSDLGGACTSGENTLNYLKCNDEADCSKLLIASFDKSAPAYVGFSTNIVYDPSPGPTDQDTNRRSNGLQVDKPAEACAWDKYGLVRDDGEHCWSIVDFESLDDPAELAGTEELRDSIPDYADVANIQIKLWGNVNPPPGVGDAYEVNNCLVEPATTP